MNTTEITVKKVEVITVYPQGRGKFSPALYFKKKWAIVKYELSNKVEGMLDVALPAECDDIVPVATAALNREIKRGTYNELKIA